MITHYPTIWNKLCLWYVCNGLNLASRGIVDRGITQKEWDGYVFVGMALITQVQRAKSPQLIKTLIVTWVFLLHERELEWLGHMIQTKHWTLKNTDLNLERALVRLKCQNAVMFCNYFTIWLMLLFGHQYNIISFFLTSIFCFLLKCKWRMKPSS